MTELIGICSKNSFSQLHDCTHVLVCTTIQNDYGKMCKRQWLVFKGYSVCESGGAEMAIKNKICGGESTKK